MEKKESYEKVLKEFKETLGESKELIPRMATLVAILKHAFPYYLWCGFYFLEEKELVVGPYQGTKACSVIGYHGVCGGAAKKKETLIVPDVHKYPGHIVCDDRAKSEIVIPVFDNDGRLVAVLDTDSDQINSFDDVDKEYLEKIMKLLFA